ncbi:MAG: metal-dependent transcriptional regulator [Defluviitaleaceae bacterium]|nr:metal-dependent transcriptional regulator [Defluviitaleaceae bacterium]
MRSQESAETYMETILVLSKSKGTVRSIDIANELDYSKPSVSVAMKKLRLDGYIEIDSNGFITLTESGREVAESMYDRHTLISDWLIFLGVDKQTAVNDACRMEHVISDQSFTAIKNHLETGSAIFNKKQ